MIDWDAIAVLAANNNLSTTYWVFDDATDQWQARNQAAAGSTPVGADVDADQYIAPGQSFFVRSADNSQTSVTIPTSSQVTGQSPVNARAARPVNSLTLKVSDQVKGTSDVTWIGFETGSSDAHDGRKDTYKRFNDLKQFPAIYTQAGKDEMIYNFVDDQFSSRTLDVQFEYANDSNGLVVEGFLDYLDPSWQVELEDKLAGQRVDLRQGSYSFTHTLGNTPQRFTLHINQSAVSLAEATSQDIYTYWQDDQLMVNLGTKSAGAEVFLYDLQGRLIAAPGTPDAGIVSLNMSSLPRGVYLLIVYNGGQRSFMQKMLH